MLYCHVKCVGEPTDYAGAWSCFDCSRQPRQIKTLMNDLGHALRQIRELNAIVNQYADEIHTLKGLVESSSSQICALQLTNSDLIKENQALKDEIKSLQVAHSSSTPVSQPKQQCPPDLLIGSSIINIQAVNPSELEINCISGVKYDGIDDVLSNLESKNKRYGSIYIVAGSSDCQQTDATTEAICLNAKKVVEHAADMSQKVVLSSVLPRTDDSTAQLKSENVNLKLKSMSSPLETVSFCDLNGSFLSADKCVNDALLLRDGLHPNFKGSQKIIDNLHINANVRRYQGQAPPQNWTSKSNSSVPPPLLPRPDWNGNPNQPPLMPYSSHQPGFSHMPPTSSSQTWNQPTCTNCKLSGHTAYRCPQTKNVLCFKCRTVGHRQKDCCS